MKMTEEEKNNERNSMVENVYRILIVDDEKEVLNALRRALMYAKQFNCEILTAENANAALEILGKKELDLILCDHRMPGMTGTEFLQRVCIKYPDVVRIIVTGYSDIQIIKEAVNKAEIHHYIEKPWVNEHLRTVVYEALQKKTERESDKKKQSKEKIMKWIKDIYEDIKSMGIDPSFIDQNLEIAKEALNSNNWESALTCINQSVNILKRFAEISSPKLEVNIISELQLPTDNWGKLNLEITNIGSSSAREVRLVFNGEFEIKEIESIPVIEVGESKNYTIEIFPKENGTFPLEIEAVCKKPLDNTEYKFEKIFWIRVGNVVGTTKLKRTFGYHKGYIKMELNIINEDKSDIRDVELELQYDEDNLILSHVKPHYNLLNGKFIIGNIEPNRGKIIEIYFDPLSCLKTEIRGKISYVDMDSKNKSNTMPPQSIRIECPTLLTDESIGLNKLKELFKNELKFNGNKVMTIPMGLDMENLYKICKELIYKYGVRQIDELQSDNPQIIEAWYYGSTNDNENKFAIKVRIDEDTNSVELFIASTNNPAMTGLLTDIMSKLSIELQEQGITQKPLRQIENIVIKETVILAKRWLLYEHLRKIEQNLKNDFAEEIKEQSRNMEKRIDDLSRRELMGITRAHKEILRIQKTKQERLDHGM